MYPTYPNRRRRRAFIALTFVSIIAVVLVAAGSLRSDTRVLVAYFDQARLAAEAHAQLAAEFRESILGDLTGLDRSRLTTTMTQMVERAQEVSMELEATEVPPDAAVPAASLSLAVSSWESGLAAFEEGLLAAVDDPEGAVSAGGLAAVLIDLEVGDRLYRQFVADAEQLRGQVDVDIGEFPPVEYLPATLAPLTFAERLADNARRTEGLAPQRDVAIAAVRLEPPETGGETDGIPILPHTESVMFQVVVANEGNLDESDLVVSLLLQGSDGAPLLEETRAIDELAAGASSTVEFPDIPVAPGKNHLATVSVSSVEGEVDVENNSRQRPFFVNEPT